MSNFYPFLQKKAGPLKPAFFIQFSILYVSILSLLRMQGTGLKPTPTAYHNPVFPIGDILTAYILFIGIFFADISTFCLFGGNFCPFPNPESRWFSGFRQGAGNFYLYKNIEYNRRFWVISGWAPNKKPGTRFPAPPVILLQPDPLT